MAAASYRELLDRGPAVEKELVSSSVNTPRRRDATPRRAYATREQRCVCVLVPHFAHSEFGFSVLLLIPMIYPLIELPVLQEK